MKYKPIPFAFLIVMICYLLILLLLLHYNGCYACFQVERDALLELKASNMRDGVLSPSSFLTWVDDQTSDCCFWQSVKCDSFSGRVIQLDLNEAYRYTHSFLLNTSLLLPFKHLKSLDLSRNYITGFPTNQGLERFSKLSDLEYLNLGTNLLNDTSLVSLNTITSLKALYLYENDITHFPTGICELEKIEELDLRNNQIGGILHPCVPHNLTRLTHLDLSYNQLIGTIPSYLLSNMSSLEFISLSGNHFDGNALLMSSLHPELQLSVLRVSNCNLNISTTHLLKFLHDQHNLKEVDLSHNKIHRNYPNWLAENNTRLVSLILADNSLDGFIHFPLNSSKNMQWINISNNQIRGQLQTNIDEVFPSLFLLDLSNNCLEGRIPSSLGNMTLLFYLFLSTNNFSGEIPHVSFRSVLSLTLSNNRLYGDLSPLFNTTYLRNLDVSNNQFTGHFPTNSVFSMNIETLDVSKNSITGRIPTWIANLTNLQSLNLGNNSFNGLFPSEFCNSLKLQFLDISENELSGLLPSCLNLTSLNYMHLERNTFSGSLPKAILNSKHLITLDLNHNSFTGAIPKWLSLLPNLSLLLLKGNLLSGSIPQEFCGLNKIDILDLSFNTLSGAIPSCLSDLAFGKFGPVEHAFDFPDISYFYSANSKQEEVEFISKRRSDSYTGEVLKYMAGMDLSSNHFTGDIPPEFGTLISIRALNLSHNQLIGSIPKALSNLKKLESMDLSHNKLSGEIPVELIGITTLAVFTVAYNNLSGRIPDMMAQFSTFDKSSYEENPFLCGPPLQSYCSSNNISDPEGVKSGESWDKYGINPVSFMASFAAAYILYLVGFVAVLYINPNWRRLWFNFINKCIRFVYPLCSLKS